MLRPTAKASSGRRLLGVACDRKTDALGLCLDALVKWSELWHSLWVVKKSAFEVEQEANLLDMSADAFMKYYNGNIPDAFPHVTLKKLNEFRRRYPGLFKENGDWVIDRHRKKVMDWLVSHH